MRLWRITQKKFALDRACLGSAMYGGRWNPVGMPALYAGSSIALCALEKFVHVSTAVLPPQSLVTVDVPDECAIYEPDIGDLPPSWNSLPDSPAAQSFGQAWLEAMTHVGMRVPSALVPEETNLIFNPRHAAYDRIRLTEMRSFVFDPRMFK